MTTLTCEKILKDWNCYDIGEDKIEYIKAKELLVSDRIDLIAKYKLVEAYDKGIDIPFYQKLYYMHLEAFTKGRFVEAGKENTKKSYQNYISIFKDLIASIKENGIQKEISVIPVGKNNTILNGSHRVAIAIYYDLTVPIIRYEDIEVKYDYSFFKERLLDQVYLDYMVTEYIHLKEDVFFACVWPRANKEKQAVVDKIIKESCNIVYKSSVQLNYQGLQNFMIQIYGRQEWCGNIDNGYKGVTGKVDECYSNSETILYVLDNTNLDSMVSLKSKIRDVYQIENSSIHISDNSKESLEIAHLLLNQNSIDILNYGYIYRNKKYISSIQQLSKELDMFGIDKEDFLVDSSGVLGVYGIRKPSDIDYLSIKNIDNCNFSIDIKTHDENIRYYSQSKEELIYNPNNYLFVYDIKFSTLAVLMEMKKKRNEKKDIEDCKIIKPYLEKQTTYKTKIYQFQYSLKRCCRNLCVKIRSDIVVLLKVIHLYDFMKKVYLKSKRIGR